MNAKEKLYAKYVKDLEALQQTCKHRKATWMGEMWAPGHSTGREVKVCDRCGMIVNSFSASSAINYTITNT